MALAHGFLAAGSPAQAVQVLPEVGLRLLQGLGTSLCWADIKAIVWVVLGINLPSRTNFVKLTLLCHPATHSLRLIAKQLIATCSDNDCSRPRSR